MTTTDLQTITLAWARGLPESPAAAEAVRAWAEAGPYGVGPWGIESGSLVAAECRRRGVRTTVPRWNPRSGACDIHT
jgi:hypothetical protein